MFNWPISVQVIEMIYLLLMLLSSSNRKYQPFPLLSYFSLVVCLRCLLHHILSRIANTFRENWDFVLISLWWVQIVGYVMACRSYSFLCTLHHLIIIIVQTYLQTLNLWNVCQIYFIECVSKIEHILLVISYSIYGAVCFQFTQFPRDGWENILLCLIIIIKSEVWTIIHWLGLGLETMVCAVCLFIFLGSVDTIVDLCAVGGCHVYSVPRIYAHDFVLCFRVVRSDYNFMLDSPITLRFTSLTQELSVPVK